MNSKKTVTLTLLLALQRIVNGDDADAIIDEVLINMTRRPDAPQLFPDDSRARRRIENRLRHASASYARLCRQVFDIFQSAIEEEGLRVHPDFADDREISHVPLENMLERATRVA